MNVFEQKNAELVIEFDRYVRELSNPNEVRQTFGLIACPQTGDTGAFPSTVRFLGQTHSACLISERTRSFAEALF